MLRIPGVGNTIRLGKCVVDRGRRVLLRENEIVRISPKAFRLLEFLLDQRPRIVPKAELMGALWPNAVVVEANLSNLVGEVRAALGENSRRPIWVKTVHSYGYGIDQPELASDAAVPDGEPDLEPFYRCWLVHERRHFELHEGVHLIGRDHRSLIPIADCTVSRRHARIEVTFHAGWSATITDLGSRNGTCVGDLPLCAPRPLTSGDRISLGLVELQFLVTNHRDPTGDVVPPRLPVEEH